jgi:hypothetical protein
MVVGMFSNYVTLKILYFDSVSIYLLFMTLNKMIDLFNQNNQILFLMTRIVFTLR